MATDIIARGLATSNSGGGGSGTSVDVQAGTGISFSGTDPIIINNNGVTDVQPGTNNGTVKVVIAEKESKSKEVSVKGLSNAAYKDVDTAIDETTKDSENLPTTKAVKESLDKKVDTSKLGDSNGVATLDENKKLKSAQLPSHNHGSNEVNTMMGYSKPSTLADKAIKNTDTLNDAIGKLEKSLDDKMDDGNYAGSSTKGGSATSAEKLTNTEQIGTSTKPVYFSADGVPVAIDYKLEKDVPSTAKLTDTTYSAGTGLRIDSTDNNKIHNMGVLSVNESATNGSIDITIGKNGAETSETKSISIHGLADAAYKDVDKAFGVPTLDANVKISVNQIPTTDNYNVDSAYPVTSKAVKAAMNTLDIVPSTRKINNITLESDVVLDGDDIKATGYAKAESKSNITGTDTINQALGKLELKSDTNETNISTLKKHMVGELTDSDFQEDSTVAMTKTVPSGMGDYAAIKVIGGKTVKDEENQVLKNAVVESVVSFPQNIWNEKWEVGSIAVDTGLNEVVSTSIRSKEYTYIGNAKILYINYKNIKSRFYSTNKTYIGYGTKDELNENMIYVPDGAKYFRFSTQPGYGNTYKNDICISLSEASYTPHTFDETTLSIPDSDRNLPCFGYGINETVQNIRDYENGTYTQMVAEVDLGDLTWTYNADHTYFESAVPSNLKVPSSNENVANIVCSIYKTIANLQYNNSENKTISISIGGEIGVCDTSYTDAAVFKEAMKGVKLVYELATPVVTDRSDILHPIRVETGGTITLQNEHSLDVPNTVVYKKEVSLI